MWGANPEDPSVNRSRYLKSRRRVVSISSVAVLLLLAAVSAASLGAQATNRSHCARRFPPVIHDSVYGHEWDAG